MTSPVHQIRPLVENDLAFVVSTWVDAEAARQRFHLPITAASKTDKIGNIALLNNDLRQSRIKIVKSKCEGLLQEMTTLSWVLSEQGVAKPDPTGSDHVLDSLLYSWRASLAHYNRPRKVSLTRPEDMIKKETEEHFRQEQTRIDRLRHHGEDTWNDDPAPWEQ